MSTGCKIVLCHAEWRSVSPVVYCALQQEVGVTYSSRHYNPRTWEMKREDQWFQASTPLHNDFQGNLGCTRLSQEDREKEKGMWGGGVSTGDEDSRFGDCMTSRSSKSARICNCQL